jgi:3-hydroxyisobutyrate dehydrogenase-like beta-hydroxyacid dehydrogenase
MVDVAILGTGRMGAAMARRVAAAGHDLTLWNRTASSARTVLDSLPAGSARVAATAADAVAGRSVVLSMLADGAATRGVLLDRSVLAALDSGAVVCDLATSGVASARALHGGLAQAAIGFVDAPVSGSVPAVNAGTLLVMASGAADAIAAVEPVLLAFARKVLRVGDAGAGQAMKLAVNLVVHVLNAAISEALILAERAGIPRDRAYDVLQDSVVAAPFVAYKRAAFLDPDTPVAMSLDLVLKDLRLITEFADELGVTASVTEAVRAAVAAACAAGSGPQDMAALSRFATTRPGS